MDVHGFLARPARVNTFLPAVGNGRLSTGAMKGGFCVRDTGTPAHASPAVFYGARPIPTGIGGASGGRWAPAEPSVLKALPVPGALLWRCFTSSVLSGACWGSPHAPGLIAQAPRAGCGGCWCAVCRWAHSSSLRATSRLLVAPFVELKERVSTCVCVCVSLVIRLEL